MKIKVEKWIIDKDNNVSFKIKSIEKCCDKITQSQNISINNEYCEGDVYLDDNTYAVKLVRAEENCDPYDDYHDMNYYYEKIHYCPFCGESIEIEIVNTVDKTEEYKQLQADRDLLWDKCRKTDSKKKEDELRNQIRELDDKISCIYMSDDFGKEID